MRRPAETFSKSIAEVKSNVEEVPHRRDRRGARGAGFAKQLNEGMNRAELFGLCDPDMDRMEKFCAYLGIGKQVPRWTDPAEFLDQKQMDAVMITVPDFAHKDALVAALKAGKHVYLEKPLANSLASCYEMVEAVKESKTVTFVGFNMRASPPHIKLREIVQSGGLGQILHIEGLEQMGVAHSASYMRRWHRRQANTGGFLNTKCCHDLDMLQWFIGHEHKVKRVASFGGNNVFSNRQPPATHCHLCPIEPTCPYHDVAGFMFPTDATKPIHKTMETRLYGNDLCVYNNDHDVIDNQTVILEWDNGVRGNFNLQLFQHRGLRQNRVWGELGCAVLSDDEPVVRVVSARTGDVTEYQFTRRMGGHGGTDQSMIDRFLDAIESGGKTDSGISHGLAATLVAIKADESRMSGKVVTIDEREFGIGC